MATGTTRPHKGKGRTYEQWDLARAVTQAGDVVADFFVGRGRWIQKFLQEGRHVVAVDRDPRWVREVRRDFEQGRLGGSS